MIKKRFISCPFVLILAIFISCSAPKEQFDFGEFKQSFLDAYWKINPEEAAWNGLHIYDSVLVIPDANYHNLQLRFSDSILNVLHAVDPNTLPENERTDYYIIENELEYTQWQINELKAHQWNPTYYNVAGSFSKMLTENYDSLKNRLYNFSIKLKSVPDYYKAAKLQIINPTTEHTKLAIQQNLGGLSVFTEDLPNAIEEANLTDLQKEQILKDAALAIQAIKDYTQWLEKLENNEPRSFRLGSALYQDKFKYAIQSGYSVDAIFEHANNRKIYLHTKMNELADNLWSKYFPLDNKPTDSLLKIRKVIEAISLEHVTPDSFQTAIERQISELERFVNEKNLLYLDPSKPLIVRKEPAYMAGVAGASISAPGPFDKTGNTYYNVGSLNGWDKDRAESYLREYNNYMLQILNIHEAIPGHYTQLVYSNLSPSLIKSVFGNGTMIEGWAVYTELMMLENGYGNDSPELWMMYYKWNLRSVCNTLLDISVHTKNMTEEDALHLLINDAFQEEAEAKGKWYRCNVTSVQLCSYYTGFKEIYDLREELKNLQGDSFNLKNFHEKFLSYGSAPVKHIRTLMLNDLKKSN